MKHFIKILTVILLFSLLSCASHTVTFFSGEFEAEVRYTLSGKEFRAVYSKSESSERLEIFEPASLSGLVVKRNDGEVTLSFSDLAYPTATDGIFKPFELFAKCEAAKTEENTYRTASGNVTVITDESGCPVSVSGAIDGREYKIEIISFSQKGELQE